MYRRMSVLAATALALTLAGCGKSGEKAPPAAADGSGAATPVAAAPAAGPATPPHRKAGLWEQTVSTAGMTQTSRLCLDDKTEAELAWWGGQAGKSACEQTSITPAPGGWSFSSVCSMGSGGTVTSQGTATGDFGSHYVVEATSSTTGAGAPQMNGEHKMKIEASWKGPCPDGMRPGDMELPNGMKINMLDMTARAPSGPRSAK